MKPFFSLLVLLALVAAVSPRLYHKYTGIQLSLQNKFLKDNFKKIVPFGANSINALLANPINTSFSFGFWPFNLKFDLINLQNAVNLTMNSALAEIELVQRNGAFFIKIPPVERWSIEFEYNYSTMFGDTIGQATLDLSGFVASVEFQLDADEVGLHLKIVALYLQFGDMHLDVSEGAFLKFFAFILNSFQWVVEFFINYLSTNLINLVLQYLKLINQIPVIPIPIFNQSIALDLAFAKSPTITATETSYYSLGEFFDYKDNVHPGVIAPTELPGPIEGGKSIELQLNEHIFNTFFGAMAVSGNLQLEGTNEDIANITGGFVHFRTDDWKYFLSKLPDQYGDLPMKAICSYERDFPTAKMSQSGQVQITGQFECEFQVKMAGSEKYSETVMHLHLSPLAILSIVQSDTNYKAFNITLVDLLINTMSVTGASFPIDSGDVAKIQQEINNLFMYAENFVNNYFLFNAIIIPDLDIITFDDLEVKFNEGWVYLGADIKINV